MIQWLALVAGLGLITGGGAALGTLLGRQSQNPETPLGFGWSFLYGVAAVATLLHVPLALTGNLPRIYYYAVLLLAGAGTGWFLWYRSGWRDIRGKLGQGWIYDLPKLLLLPTYIMVGLALASTTLMPMNSYDGRSAFALKARILYDQQTIRTDDFEDINRLHFNSHYPLLIPLLLAETYAIQDTWNDNYTRIVFLAFVCALLSLVVAELRRYMSARAAACWTLALLLTPMVHTTFEGGGLSASADIPLACYVTAAVIAVGDWLRRRNWQTLFTAGLMLGAACMTKAEGNIWVAGLAGGALALVVWRGIRIRRTDWMPLLTGAAVFALCFGVSTLARRHVPHSPYLREYGQALRLDWLVQVWARPLDIALFAAQDYTRVSRWNFFWVLLIAAFVLLRRRPAGGRTPDAIWYGRVVVGLIAMAYLGIFVVTPYHLHFHLRTALCRLSLQFLPLAAIYLAEHIDASGWLHDLAEEWQKARINPENDAAAQQNLRYFRVEERRRAG